MMKTIKIRDNRRWLILRVGGGMVFSLKHVCPQQEWHGLPKEEPTARGRYQ
jgi:hypothetical protein